jgi:ResB-like family
LRWHRTYKPYTIGLEEFKHDFYPNTSKPKNFSSKVQLVNPEMGDQRDTTIVMNSPMRYRGETFYQSGWLIGDQGTILQVVRNPGWVMPYLSCTLVTLGMIIHFGMYLINYLRRRAAI